MILSWMARPRRNRGASARIASALRHHGAASGWMVFGASPLHAIEARRSALALR